MKAAVLVVLVAGLALVEPHGFLRSPLARTSIQLDPSFGTQMPYWWDNQGVWCGNIPQDLNYSQCGRCGDAPGGTSANQGGEFDKGVIVATYTAGSRITVVGELSAAHNGYFEVELCASETETDNCFVKLPVLSAPNGIKNGNACVTMQTQNINAEVQLPAGVTCNRCTLRWTYRTSYGAVQGDPDYDACYNYKPAQTFRNCADIKITN